MPLPKPGDEGYEDMVDAMRADIERTERYAPVVRTARKLIKEDGRDFDEEFAKWEGGRDSDGVNDCTGYKSPKECPHNGEFDALSNACKECIEDATIGYDTSDIL